MHEPERVIFTNMVMVSDGQGRVLTQRRTDPTWPGLAFPGGHVEEGETFAQAAAREVMEETGIAVTGLRLCGIKHWVEDGIHSVVLLYQAQACGGRLHSSAEGEVQWMPLERFRQLPLAEGMDATLRVFLDDRVSEHAFTQADGCWQDIFA